MVVWYLDNISFKSFHWRHCPCGRIHCTSAGSIYLILFFTCVIILYSLSSIHWVVTVIGFISVVIILFICIYSFSSDIFAINMSHECYHFLHVVHTFTVFIPSSFDRFRFLYILHVIGIIVYCCQHCFSHHFVVTLDHNHLLVIIHLSIHYITVSRSLLL